MIDWLILREWVKAFVISLGVTFSLLLLLDMTDNLPDLLETGASGGQLGFYYLVLAPSFLPVVLPVAFMISIQMTLGSLHRHHEIIAMRAAGLSLFRITRVIWQLAVVLALTLLALNAKWVPWSVESARGLRTSYAIEAETAQLGEDEAGAIHNMTFHNHEERRLWYMNRFSGRSLVGRGVTISQLNAEGREITRWIAGQGYYDQDEGHWTLLDGREMRFNATSGEAIFSLPFERKPLPKLRDEPRLMETLRKESKELSMLELDQITKEFSPDQDPRVYAHQVRYHALLASPLACLVVASFAVPFAVSGVRANPMVGVVKAFGAFLLYYMANGIFELLGQQQVLDPVPAAWIPTAVALVLGGFLCWQAQ